MKGQNIRPNPLAWCERTSGRRSRSAKGSPAQARHPWQRRWARHLFARRTGR